MSTRPTKSQLPSRIMIAFCVVVMGYHLLVITGVIPYGVAWGGKLETDSQMIVFESISILIVSVLLLTLLMWDGVVPRVVPHKVLRFMLWGFVVLFLLNTIGNLFAESIYERAIATPLTLISAILLYAVVRRQES